MRLLPVSYLLWRLIWVISLIWILLIELFLIICSLDPAVSPRHSVAALVLYLR